MILQLIPKAAFDPAINSESRIFYSCPAMNSENCLQSCNEFRTPPMILKITPKAAYDPAFNSESRL
jgi:hypothetical protein